MSSPHLNHRAQWPAILTAYSKEKRLGEIAQGCGINAGRVKFVLDKLDLPYLSGPAPKPKVASARPKPKNTAPAKSVRGWPDNMRFVDAEGVA